MYFKRNIGKFIRLLGSYCEIIDSVDGLRFGDTKNKHNHQPSMFNRRWSIRGRKKGEHVVQWHKLWRCTELQLDLKDHKILLSFTQQLGLNIHMSCVDLARKLSTLNYLLNDSSVVELLVRTLTCIFDYWTHVDQLTLRIASLHARQ